MIPSRSHIIDISFATPMLNLRKSFQRLRHFGDLDGTYRHGSVQLLRVKKPPISVHAPVHSPATFGTLDVWYLGLPGLVAEGSITHDDRQRLRSWVVTES